jgi:hypothetical protein
MKEWDAAESKHSGLLINAQDKFARLRIEREQPAMPRTDVIAGSGVSIDIRNQIIAMGKKGFEVADISRACGMPEGEVDVLLSLARMQR